MLQAGAIGLVGLGMNHLAGLREASAAVDSPKPSGKAKSCIYIFLSGGLAQHDSFDMKPDAPENIRGEFRPIATNTPGIEICEHLPLLARRSRPASAPTSRSGATGRASLRSPMRRRRGAITCRRRRSCPSG